MEKRIEEIGQRVNKVENKLDHLIMEVKFIREDLTCAVTKNEFEIVEKRIFRLEQAVGLAA